MLREEMNKKNNLGHLVVGNPESQIFSFAQIDKTSPDKNIDLKFDRITQDQEDRNKIMNEIMENNKRFEESNYLNKNTIDKLTNQNIDH